MATPETIHQLKINLNDAKPPIWRRILVPENITLYQLHEILQIVMGWTDSHLHLFTIDNEIYGDAQNDEADDLGTKDENLYHLNGLGLHEKAKFSYAYDFGDGWEHTIQLEKILPAEKDIYYPVCVTGKRACPPEDVGGIWGYEDILKALADPNHVQHNQMVNWAGNGFDPEAFDLDAVNASLQTLQNR